MAPKAVTRSAWVISALASAAALAVLALHGERPGAGFSRYEPSGIMIAIAPDTVTSVEVTRGRTRWRFERDRSERWRISTGPRVTAVDSTEAIELGLRFLHGSAPQRRMESGELSDTPLSELGLDPPRLEVKIVAAAQAPFVVEMGGPNPQGLARYARLGGDVVLLNRYVVEQWEKVIATP